MSKGRRPLTKEVPSHYNIRQEVMDMLDEKDLLAIRSIVKEEVDAAEQRTDSKLSAMEERITKNAVAMMEAYFGPKFNLLADGQSSILEKLVPRSRGDDLEDEVKFLKSIVRQMNEDLQKLKKAQ